MDHEHEAEHFPKVTTDETAAATDTGAFLKVLGTSSLFPPTLRFPSPFYVHLR
jgi:hypothetical protein